MSCTCGRHRCPARVGSERLHVCREALVELRSKACTLPRFRVGIARMQDFETQVPPFPAWPSTMSSEGGIKVSTLVWRSTRGVAVESFAPCQDPESKSRACKASKCKCHPPVLNARLGLQAPRRMGACEFLRSSITCLMVPRARIIGYGFERCVSRLAGEDQVQRSWLQLLRVLRPSVCFPFVLQD